MWQEMKNRAAASCAEYIQEAGLLGPSLSSQSSQKIQTWVPSTLKAQIAAYTLQWHRALPLKGIIIGQSPTPYDKGSPSSTDTAPALAASFAFSENRETPAVSEILANEISLCGKDRNGVLEAIRDCWQLVDHGILSVYALPLGMENRFDWSPATESDTLQMQILARCLCDLVALSAEMSSRGSTVVIAMGRWAHDLSSELRKQFNERLHSGQTKYWTLDIRASLYHPARTWHKFNTRNSGQVTLGREDELLLLHDLFMSGRDQCNPDVPTLKDKKGTNDQLKRGRFEHANGRSGKPTNQLKNNMEKSTRDHSVDKLIKDYNYGYNDVRGNMRLHTPRQDTPNYQFQRALAEKMEKTSFHVDVDESHLDDYERDEEMPSDY